jgi:hypothetical protein
MCYQLGKSDSDVVKKTHSHAMIIVRAVFNLTNFRKAKIVLSAIIERSIWKVALIVYENISKARKILSHVFLKFDQRPALAISWIALVLIVLPRDAYATLLEISLPTEGTANKLTPVIYGKASQTYLMIGEKKYDLKQTSEKILQSSSNKSDATSGSGESQNSEPVFESEEDVGKQVGASYLLKSSEFETCTDNSRYAMLRHLLEGLGGKVKNVSIVYETKDWQECVAEIKDDLTNLQIPTTVQQVGGNRKKSLAKTQDHGTLRLTLEFWSRRSVALKPGGFVAPKDGQVIENRAISVRIGDKAVPINSDGYFVAIVESFGQVTLTVDVSGRSHDEFLVVATPMSIGEKVVTNSADYNRIRVRSAGLVPAIELLPEIPGSSDISFYGIGGIGLGHGRGLPGEVKGRRSAWSSGFTLRQVYRDYGLHFDVSGTYAKQSVVPWTLLLGSTIVKTGTFANAIGLWRLGIGTQFFKSQVRPFDDTTTVVAVPELVVSPLIHLGIEGGWKSLYFGARVNITPLYVTESGFYPSLNPSIEVGYNLSGELAVYLGSSSDLVRYPTPQRETSLRLDSTFLGLKMGVF